MTVTGSLFFSSIYFCLVVEVQFREKSSCELFSRTDVLELQFMYPH